MADGSEFKEKLKSIRFGSVPGGANSAEVDRINQTERNWDRDIPAYKRLRQDGLQPKGVDGAAHLEAEATHETEIANGFLMKNGTAERIQEIHQEVSSKDVGVGD